LPLPFSVFTVSFNAFPEKSKSKYKFSSIERINLEIFCWLTLLYIIIIYILTLQFQIGCRWRGYTLRKFVLRQHKPCVLKRSQGFCVVRTQICIGLFKKYVNRHKFVWNFRIFNTKCRNSTQIYVDKRIFQIIQHKSLCSDNTKSLWLFSNINILRVYGISAFCHSAHILAAYIDSSFCWYSFCVWHVPSLTLMIWIVDFLFFFKIH
jgi:hypothetical protein